MGNVNTAKVNLVMQRKELSAEAIGNGSLVFSRMVVSGFSVYIEQNYYRLLEQEEC